MTQQIAEYVDHMGNDTSVVNAARLSFGVKSKAYTDEQNKSLINFLAYGVSSKEIALIIKQLIIGFDSTQNIDSEILARKFYDDLRQQDRHWTPFAHTAISIKMKAPIPIRTQCFKHKTGLVENEESRRYISTTPEIFIPEFRAKPEGSIKQGSGGLHPDHKSIQDDYRRHCEEGINKYENYIKRGVAPEQARLVLPQGTMVNWLWTGNLLAFANFYNKRSDSHAQTEIQELAEFVRKVVEPLFPVSWNALTRE